MTMQSKQQNAAQEELLREPGYPWYVKTLAAAIVCAAVAGGWYWYSMKSSVTSVHYVTEQVERGRIRVTVSADGTLNPMRTVTLGSELSGIVSKVNVDVNDFVENGQTLIELDTRNLEARVAQNRAAVQSARAKRAESEANLRESELKLKRMKELNRLSGGQMPSRTELETQQAAVDTAKAQVAVSEASIADAQASLKTAETDLSKAMIKSPIDGVVLARSVEPGYAVAASLQAVELLTLATDLKSLELQVAVDEADIGVVKEGQKAYFTVSSYPNKRFPAVLKKVAYGAKTTENVVTYTTYLDVDNTDMLLRPGMTASATISTAQKDQVLLVPNSAFRFAPKKSPEKSASMANMMAPRPPHSAEAKQAKVTVQHGETQRSLYVLRDGQPVRVRVVTGLTDGMKTEIVSGDIAEGDKVVVDQQKAGTAK